MDDMPYGAVAPLDFENSIRMGIAFAPHSGQVPVTLPERLYPQSTQLHSCIGLHLRRVKKRKAAENSTNGNQNGMLSDHAFRNGGTLS